MISQLVGKVSHKGAGFVIVSDGFIGYKVYGTTDLFMKTREGEQISLWTHLAVRENALDLYGFISQEEVDFFEMLMTVSGIGPRSALAIMNLAPVKTLSRAIATEDFDYLTKVSGIGKKSAAKIVVELKDKVRNVYGEGLDVLLGGDGEAVEALKALGYSAGQAREALKIIGARREKDADETQGVSDTIKEALRILSEPHSSQTPHGTPLLETHTKRAQKERPTHRA